METETTLVSPDIFLGLYNNGEIAQNESYTIIIKDLESLNLATNSSDGVLLRHYSGVLFTTCMMQLCELTSEFKVTRIDNWCGTTLFYTREYNFVTDWVEYVRIPDSAWCAGYKNASKITECSNIVRTSSTVAGNINSIAKSLVSTKYYKQSKSTTNVTQVQNSVANVTQVQNSVANVTLHYCFSTLHSAIVSALYTALDTLLGYYGENSENYLSFRKTYYGRFIDFVYYMQIHYNLGPEHRWSEIDKQWNMLCSSIQNEYNIGNIECMGLEV